MNVDKISFLQTVFAIFMQFVYTCEPNNRCFIEFQFLRPWKWSISHLCYQGKFLVPGRSRTQYFCIHSLPLPTEYSKTIPSKFQFYLWVFQPTTKYDVNMISCKPVFGIKEFFGCSAHLGIGCTHLNLCTEISFLSISNSQCHPYRSNLVLMH